MWIFKQLGHTCVPNSSTQSDMFKSFYIFASFMLINTVHMHAHKSLCMILGHQNTRCLDFLYRLKQKERKAWAVWTLSTSLMSLFVAVQLFVQISGLFQVHQIGELYLMKILFISCCPLKMSLFLIFCMIYVCWTGSIFNSKVVRGVSRDTAICL